LFGVLGGRVDVGDGDSVHGCFLLGVLSLWFRQCADDALRRANRAQG